MIIKRKCKIKTYVKNFPDNEYPYQLKIEIGNYTIPSNLFRTKSGAEDLGNLIKSLRFCSGCIFYHTLQGLWL